MGSEQLDEERVPPRGRTDGQTDTRQFVTGDQMKAAWLINIFGGRRTAGMIHSINYSDAHLLHTTTDVQEARMYNTINVIVLYSYVRP